MPVAIMGLREQLCFGRFVLDVSEAYCAMRKF
jgi:hypothetical protein